MNRMHFILILLGACSTMHEEEAGVGRYFFEIVQAVPDERDGDLIDPLADALIRKRYAITNSAGYEWPFFQEYDLDDDILRSDLMPPHTIGHQLIDARSSTDEFEDGDARLEILIRKEEDGYSFDMITFKWEDQAWKKVVDTGNHKIPSAKYTSREELIQILYKTIVRYSFK